MLLLKVSSGNCNTNKSTMIIISAIIIKLIITKFTEFHNRHIPPARSRKLKAK